MYAMGAGNAHSLRWSVVAAVVLAAVGAPARAQELAYTGSAQYATGNYIFAERTSSVYLFNGLSVTARRLNASMSVPLIMQNAPWISYSGAGAVPTGGPQHGSMKGKGAGGRGAGHQMVLVDTASYSEVGFGDPMVHATVTVLEDRGAWPGIRLAAGVKAPLADVDRGFGTGAWDAGGGVSLSKALGGRFVFVDVMYWSLGDMEDLVLRDPVSYSVALGQPLMNGKLGVLASLSGYTEIIADVAPPVQAGLGVTYTTGAGHGLSGSASFGLTESAPDVSVSFGWRVAL